MEKKVAIEVLAAAMLLVTGFSRIRMRRSRLINTISAAMFGAAHGSFISFIFTFILGVILALALDATRSIYVPMMIHISFNASSYLITLALDGATGAETLIICIGGALLGASALASLFVLGKTKKSPAPDGTENGDTVK